MTFTTTKAKFKTIKAGELDFYISDGYSVAARAGLEITTDCPIDYKLIIQTAHSKGWIKLVATMHDHEYMWDELSR